jgi:hypothetical protein
MDIKDAITSLPLTGECSLDLEKASNLFDATCFISKYGDEYMLVKGRRDSHDPSLKITIKPCDAVYLIERLKLIEEKCLVFNLASSFYLRSVQ